MVFKDAERRAGQINATLNLTVNLGLGYGYKVPLRPMQPGLAFKR